MRVNAQGNDLRRYTVQQHKGNKHAFTLIWNIWGCRLFTKECNRQGSALTEVDMLRSLQSFLHGLCSPSGYMRFSENLNVSCQAFLCYGSLLTLWEGRCNNATNEASEIALKFQLLINGNKNSNSHSKSTMANCAPASVSHLEFTTTAT